MFFKNINKVHLFSRLKKLIFLHLQHLPVAGHIQRPMIVKWGGVNIDDPESTFIGEGVVFDSVHPENIYVEKGVRITMNSIILTHYFEPQTNRYYNGNVRIKENAFLGANTIITKPVTVGKCSVVGAGSVVTKDIPDYEIWAGNPARFIKKIEHE